MTETSSPATEASGPIEADLPTEREYAAWLAWLKTEGYDFADDSYQAEAFAAGMRAQPLAIPAEILVLLALARKDIAEGWRETTDERTRALLDRALTTLSHAGVRSPDPGPIEETGAASPETAEVSASRGHDPGCGCRDCCEDASVEQAASGPVYGGEA